jgi:hypothetical protein
VLASISSYRKRMTESLPIETRAGANRLSLVQVTGGGVPTIALVDDDHNILATVSIALEAEGYRIMTYSGWWSGVCPRCHMNQFLCRRD